jgi:Protein of unknown function (DUF3892)
VLRVTLRRLPKTCGLKERKLCHVPSQSLSVPEDERSAIVPDREQYDPRSGTLKDADRREGAEVANRIGCINKTDRYDAHDRIHSIGGTNSDGGRWKRSQRQAIADIESGKYAFYVEKPAGHRVDVIVAVSRYGNKYLKTVADGEQPDNLLSLPECP